MMSYRGFRNKVNNDSFTEQFLCERIHAIIFINSAFLQTIIKKWLHKVNYIVITVVDDVIR